MRVHCSRQDAQLDSRRRASVVANPETRQKLERKSRLRPGISRGLRTPCGSGWHFELNVAGVASFVVIESMRFVGTYQGTPYWCPVKDFKVHHGTKVCVIYGSIVVLV